MKRYFFNIEDGQCIRDPRGETLPDINAARRTAIDILSEIMIGHVHDLLPEGRLEVKVLDADHRPIFSVVASTAVH